MPASLNVLAYALLPTLAILIGGGIALRRPPGPAVRGYVQHFAAGLVFAVATVEVLPEVRRDLPPLPMAASFGLGVVVMLTLRWFTERLEQQEEEQHERPWGLMGAVGIDVLVDGLLLGIGFAVSAKVGQLFTIALALENFSLGLATLSTLGRLMQRRETLLVLAGMALLFLTGALLGATLLHGLSASALALVLSFSLAALLYLVIEELLVEAHELPDTPLTTALFFVGFLLFLLYETIG